MLGGNEARALHEHEFLELLHLELIHRPTASRIAAPSPSHAVNARYLAFVVMGLEPVELEWHLVS